MLTIPIGDEGPDVDRVRELASSDPSIKGIWCVPKYSNPTGITYSPRVVEALATMPTAAPDFRIYWDNAYAIHHLSDDHDELADILQLCVEAGNPDRVLIFASTSKVTFAGAGLAAIAASPNNLEFLRAGLSMQTIGPDKLNQLRHIKFFQNIDGVHEHMRKHAKILKPKFDAVDESLTRHLSGTGLAEWSAPKGGYFVSVNTGSGCATEVVQMAADAGVKLTKAGATFPYGHDPEDRNIRLAPSMPPLEEVRQAMELVAVSIRVVGIAKLLQS